MHEEETQEEEGIDVEYGGSELQYTVNRNKMARKKAKNGLQRKEIGCSLFKRLEKKMLFEVFDGVYYENIIKQV